MNDSNDPLNDEAIEDLLRPLGNVNPAEAVRSANRAAVERALDRRACPPWWQRSVAVPMPLAIAASVALLITAAAALWPAFGHTADADAPVHEHEELVESDTTTPQWSVTRYYILSIESLAQFQKPLHPESTEDRNDS